MAKIGEQVGSVSAGERRTGRIGQQIGAKKTRAEIVREEQQRRIAKEEQQRKQQELQASLSKVSNATNINQYKKLLNEVPDWQKPYIQKTINELETKQQSSISKIKSEINQAKQLAERYKQEAERFNREGRDERAESTETSYAITQKRIEGLSSGLNKLQKGELVSASSVIQYSQALSSGVEQRLQGKEKLIRTLAKDVSLKEAQQIVATGKITKEQMKDIAPTTLTSIGLKPSKVETGGYYVDPKTGLGMSSMQDLSKEGYVKVGTPGEDFSIVQQRTAQVKPSYVTPTPFGDYIDITKSGGFEAATKEIKTKEFETGQSIKQDPMIGQSVISEAPSEFSLWKRETAKEGYVSGTLNWLGSATSRKTTQLQNWQKGYFESKGWDYEPYQEQATANLAGFTARTAPYFTPGGAYLLIGEGVEGLMSEGGKERIGKRFDTIESWDLPGGKVTSSVLSISPEVAQIGLGFGAIPTRYKVVETGGVKPFRTQEFNIGGKNTFARVTQTTSTKYVKQNWFNDIKTEFGFQPKKYTFQKGQVYVEKPTEFTKIGEPYLLETSKVSKAPDNFLSEGELRIFLKDAKFTPTKKYTYVKPVAGKQIILGEETISVGGTYSFELGKAQPKKYTIDLDRIFRTQKFDLSVSKVKGLPQIIPERQVLLGDSFSQTINLRTGRGLGKIGKEKTTILKILPEEQSFTSFKGRGTPSSQAYFQKLYQPQIQLPKPTIKPTKTSQTIIKTPTSSKPSTFVAVTTGQFTTPPISQQTSGMFPILDTRVDSSLQVKSYSDIQLKSLVEQNIKLDSAIKIKSDSMLNLKIKQKQQQKSPQVQRLKTKQILEPMIRPMRFTPTRKAPPRRTPKKKPPFGLMGFDFPSFSLPTRKLTTSKPKKKPIKRQASLVALGENIFAKEKGKGEFSGLTIRPIIIDGKKKKKRRTSEWI